MEEVAPDFKVLKTELCKKSKNKQTNKLHLWMKWSLRCCQGWFRACRSFVVFVDTHPEGFTLSLLAFVLWWSLILLSSLVLRNQKIKNELGKMITPSGVCVWVKEPLFSDTVGRNLAVCIKNNVYYLIQRFRVFIFILRKYLDKFVKVCVFK